METATIKVRAKTEKHEKSNSVILKPDLPQTPEALSVLEYDSKTKTFTVKLFAKTKTDLEKCIPKHATRTTHPKEHEIHCHICDHNKKQILDTTDPDLKPFLKQNIEQLLKAQKKLATATKTVTKTATTTATPTATTTPATTTTQPTPQPSPQPIPENVKKKLADLFHLHHLL